MVEIEFAENKADKSFQILEADFREIKHSEIKWSDDTYWNICEHILHSLVRWAHS